MKISPLANITTIILVSILCLVATQVNAQVVPIEENFDSVTVPSLPADWSTLSLQGTNTARTSNTSPFTSPNSAFIPNPSTTTLTALLTKTFSIVTSLPTTNVYVSFRHKRGMENTFDGGVLEVSINGAAFADVKSPAIGGSFGSGDYNLPSIASGNPLVGRSAWSGISASFESVSLTLPNIPDNSTLVFRFLLGTDTIFGAAGWFIDNFSVSADVDIIKSVTPLSSEIAPGAEVIIDDTFVNSSTFNLNYSTNYIVTAASQLKTFTVGISSLLQKFGNWWFLLTGLEIVPSFSSATVNAKIQDIPGRAAGKVTISSSSVAALTGLSSPITFVSSSPNIPSGIINAQIVHSPFDPCTAPPGVLPYPLTGRIVVYPAPLTCLYGAATLTLQNLGAAAAIFFAPIPSSSPPAGQYPAPFVNEASTAGLNIPMFTIDNLSYTFLASAIGAPGSSTASIAGNNSSEVRTIAYSSQLFSGDPNMGNNIVTTLVNVVTDVDADGTPDYRDSCKNDSTKVSPGSCGCGIADVDANRNGVVDCLTTQDFKKQLTQLRSVIKKLKRNSKTFKASIKTIKSLRTSAVKAVGISKASSVTTLNGSSVSSLSKKADKSLASLINAKSSTAFLKAQKAALKDLDKLIKSLAA